MIPQRSADPYSPQVTTALNQEIQRTRLPFDLHVVDEITSTMNIVAWGRSRLGTTAPGLTLVAKNQTHGRGHSGAWLSNPNDLKVTFLLPSPPQELVSLAKAGFAWATAEAIRIAADHRQVSHPFEAAIKWPNDVRIVSDSRTLKVAGVMVVAPDRRSEDRDMCQRFWWDCPPGSMLVGIGVGLVRPSVDQIVPTHLGDKRLSEIATTLDRWTTHPVTWTDLLLPLMHKVSLVDSLLREGAADALARTIARRFALGSDGHVLLEERSAPPTIVTVRGATGAGLLIERDGSAATVPFERIVRFTPHGVEGV